MLRARCFGRLADNLAKEGAELLEAGNPGLLRLAVYLSPSNAQFRYFAACAASALGARDKAESMRIAGTEPRCIGVDPAPTISSPVPPNARIFTQTSDDFFLRNGVCEEPGGLALDLAFIDGLHLFPHNARTAQRERATGFWTGDVWRLVVPLKKQRPDLSIHMIAAPPTGLRVVRNLDLDSEYLSRNLARVTGELMRLEYGFPQKDRTGKLVPNDWRSVQRLLAPQGQTNGAGAAAG